MKQNIIEKKEIKCFEYSERIIRQILENEKIIKH